MKLRMMQVLHKIKFLLNTRLTKKLILPFRQYIQREMKIQRVKERESSCAKALSLFRMKLFEGELLSAVQLQLHNLDKGSRINLHARSGKNSITYVFLCFEDGHRVRRRRRGR